MTPFAKLSFRIPVDASVVHRAEPYLQFTKKQKYNRDLDPKFTSTPTEIMAVPDAVVADTLALLPSAVLQIENPQVFLIRMVAMDAPYPVLPAHVDYNRSCGINFYLEAAGETTHYYDWDAASRTLTETSQFCAEVGECWLLDTTIPHSVTLKPKTQRTILTVSFVDAPFAAILNACTSKGA